MQIFYKYLHKGHSMKKLLAILALVPALAFAWTPIKPITVIFPNGPGAGNEISFFIVAEQVEKQTGVTFLREHRPGVDGNLAMNHFATLPADGYTVAVPACNSQWVTGEVWYPQALKYNIFDFEPVANIARSPLAFWAHPSSKVNTPEDLIKEIREKKRPINFAIGGGGHKLAVEYLTDKLAVPGGDNVQTAMYKGPAQALLDVMGGHVEFGVTPVGVGYPHVKTGKLKLIGLASEVPLKGLEKAPLMSKYAPGLNLYGCWNVILPKGTPTDIQQWYADKFVPLIKNPIVKEKFDENLMFITTKEHTPSGVHASMALLRREWQPIARKIKPE
jgi:tripartite-type tricarboxylate transporter receptor subunit TctC